MTRLRQFKRLLTLTALLVMVQLFVIQAMAASGALHKRCHDHADEADHQCAVTLMLNGGYDIVVPTVTPTGQEIEPPPEPVMPPKPVDSAPSHLVGGVLAHAPPRGP